MTLVKSRIFVIVLFVYSFFILAKANAANKSVTEEISISAVMKGHILQSQFKTLLKRADGKKGMGSSRLINLYKGF